MIDKSFIGAKVRVSWKRPDDDWPFFTVLSVRRCRGIVRLRGEDYPDGTGKHDGDKFWVSIAQVVSVERL